MSLQKKTVSGMLWSFMQLFSKQIINFVVSIVLARLLLPSEFGVIGMLAVFISVGKTLINGGLASSLIRTTDADEEDFSTVFFFNFFGSLLIYIVLFFSATFIADFYEQEILIGVIRLYGLTFIIDAFSTIQITRLTQKMDFKTQMKVALPSLVLSSLLGVFLAYQGYGVWSLVWMHVFQSFLNSLQLWIFTKWKPLFVFNKEKFKYHFNFGYKLLLSGLLDAVFSNIYTLIIGKFFSPTQLGFYSRANSFKNLPVNNISKALSKVTYPMFAKIKDDDVKLRLVYKKILKMVTFIMAPILIFLGVLAEPVFRFLFTEKWLPAVPYFQIVCISGLLYPFHSYNVNILNIKGRSDLFLKLEIFKKIIIVISILIAIPFGVKGLLWGSVIASFLGLFVNTYYSGKFINYSGLEQLKDVFLILLSAVFSGLVIFFIDELLIKKSILDLLRIILGLGIGLLTYFLFSYLFKISSLTDLKKILIKE